MPFDGTGSPAYEHLDKIDQVIGILASPSRWCKGSERNRNGQYCIRGALLAVDGLTLLEPAVLRSIHQMAGRHFRRIEEFNDHPRTTHAQVLAVLHRTRDEILGGAVREPALVGSGGGGRFAFGWAAGLWQRVFG
jgi:hypothetical protein